MKCVLHSTIVLLPLITVEIFYFCTLGRLNGKSGQENSFVCKKQVLSCTKIANQLINELELEEYHTKTFQHLQDKYSQDGKVTSKIECQDDLAFCKTKTIEIIADALQVKFSFNCTANLNEGRQREYHCDQWDYFDIYIHCDAKSNEYLLPLELLWEQNKCKFKKNKNVQCDRKCTWTHEIKSRSRVVKRQAIVADTSVIQITTPPPTTPATTTVSMASISRGPTITMAVPTMNPSTTDVTTAAGTTPTMPSNTVIPTALGIGTTKPKRRIPAHCLRKHVGPPPGPITTTSTPSTMTGTGPTTTPSTMIGTGSTTTPSTMTGTGSTTPSSMTGTGSTTTPSTMTGTVSTTTPSTMTGTVSTTTLSTMTGTVSTTTPSTMTGTVSTTTLSTMTGTGSTTAPSTMTGTGSTTTPSTMTGTGSTTTPSTMTGTGSTTTPSTMTGTGSTTDTPTTVAGTTTSFTTPAPPPRPPPPPPPPPPPRPPPRCTDVCKGPGYHKACDGRCFTCVLPGPKPTRLRRCLRFVRPIYFM